ncbi:MAG: sel1 repeat family protein, partial [Treponema sp.]|nr:sel1 repeat family protein [Treponema sp.]
RDSSLLLLIAKLFDDEKSGIKDNKKAAFCYEKAAEGGCTEAQVKIGEIYLNKKDYYAAIYWFEKAARKGNDEKQNLLGHIYLNGEYIERNLKNAYSWFRLSAKGGNPDSQFYTGLFCYCGKGLKNPDIKKAKNWWEKAAEQKNVPAQYCLKIAFDMKVAEEIQVEFLEKLKACLDVFSYHLFLEMFNINKSIFQEKIQRAENLQNNLFTIRNVKGIAPFSIGKKWRHSMQLILTDNGVFIDNICSNGGHNWVEEIGKTVRAKCVHKYKHDWLIYINEENKKKENNDSNKKIEYNNKVVMEEVIAQRCISPEKGDCKFIKQDSTFILAQEKGMRNQSLP